MPPKRAATSASTTRPAKKSAKKVPQSLTEASEVLPQAEFVKLVKKHVLPGLDDEAFKEVFQQAVIKLKRQNAIHQKIKLDDHKKSLKQHARELKSSLKHDWHDGSDDQMQIKNYITGEVLAWLNDLFEVAIEGGTQLATTQKCLVFIESQRLTSCKTTVEQISPAAMTLTTVSQTPVATEDTRAHLTLSYLASGETCC